MTKPDWAREKVENVFGTLDEDGDAWIRDFQVYRKFSKLLRAERARARRVVRQVRAQYKYCDRFDVGVRKACDELLRRLK